MLTQHRMVVAESFLREDAATEERNYAFLEDFLGGFNQPTYRGMRVNGVRVHTWSSQHGWSGL